MSRFAPSRTLLDEAETRAGGVDNSHDNFMMGYVGARTRELTTMLCDVLLKRQSRLF